MPNWILRGEKMKNKKFYLSISALLLLCAMLFNIVSCTKVKAADLMEGVTPRKVEAREELSEDNAAVNCLDNLTFKDLAFVVSFKNVLPVCDCINSLL